VTLGRVRLLVTDGLGLSISETTDLLRFSNTTTSRVYREWSEKEKIFSQRQVRVDRKATVTQKNHYNWGMQKRICEHTMSNLEADGLQQQKTHQVPLQSAKNSKLRATIHPGSLTKFEIW